MRFALAPRVLDFDIENRPLSYAGQDFTFSEVTAIACKMIGERGPVESWCLGEMDVADMLYAFLPWYNDADIVTGHNIIKHDLPIINGACLENGLPPLHPKLVCDTYFHLKRRQGVSASQESLAAILRVKSPKVGMSQAAWREANRLTPEGIEKTRKRVTGDVRQHIAMRAELLRREWLQPPKMWSP